MNNIAIIDVETTGLTSSDRIIEFAAVVIDGRTLRTVDEFETLLNPERDVGRTDIHGITPSMVSAAPTFGEVADQIARILSGSVIAAHNLPFDSRFMSLECRSAGVQFDPGEGICTYRMTGEKLVSAAARLGISTSDHHRAICDARVAAEIIRRVGPPHGVGKPAQILARRRDLPSHTLTRDATAGGARRTAGAASRAPTPTSNSVFADYFCMLDIALSDGIVTAKEREALRAEAARVGLDGAGVARLHSAYFASIFRAHLRDGRTSPEEEALLSRIANALGIDQREVPNAPAPGHQTIRAGMRVCFTGTVVHDGTPVSREELEGIAAEIGLQPVDSVSRSGCDLLVASDPYGSSHKIEKARQYGIPIAGAGDFIRITRPFTGAK